VSAAQGYRVTLRKVQWTEDLPVSGELDWPGRSGTVRAHVKLGGPEAFRGALDLEWPEGVAASHATVRGVLGGQAVSATAPAP
jgi:hypothetical protein